jgi:hypothetical protein
MRLKNNSVGTQTGNKRIREVVTGLLYESPVFLNSIPRTLRANPRSENCHFLASPELTAKRATRG